MNFSFRKDRHFSASVYDRDAPLARGGLMILIAPLLDFVKVGHLRLGDLAHAALGEEPTFLTIRFAPILLRRRLPFLISRAAEASL